MLFCLNDADLIQLTQRRGDVRPAHSRQLSQQLPLRNAHGLVAPLIADLDESHDDDQLLLAQIVAPQVADHSRGERLAILLALERCALAHNWPPSRSARRWRRSVCSRN